MKNFILTIAAVSLYLFSTVHVQQVNAQNVTEKSKISLDLTFHQTNNETPELKVYAKSKVGKKFKPVEGVLVNIFIGEENADGFIGRIETKKDGTASLVITKRANENWAASKNPKFIATVTKSDRFEDTSSEIEISKARIELLVEEKDSVRTLVAKVFALQDSGWVAVPGVEVKFVAKRYFNDLPIGENVATDAQGSATTEFKLTLPGDGDGNIFVAAKIEDNETYGSIQSTKQVKWGTRLAQDDSFDKRTLWATRDKTPLWLLIFPGAIITVVWGFIFYLISLIWVIRKIGTTQ